MDRVGERRCVSESKRLCLPGGLGGAESGGDFASAGLKSVAGHLQGQNRSRIDGDVEEP